MVEQCIDLLGLEEADICAIVALAGDSQDALDHLGVLWMAEGSIAKEGVDSRQAGVARAGTVVPVGLRDG